MLIVERCLGLGIHSSNNDDGDTANLLQCESGRKG